MTLEECFDDYREKKREKDLTWSDNLKSDIYQGRAFACFATSVILHSVFSKIGVNIAEFFTDGPGDGKIDGIAFSIDGKPIHSVGDLNSNPITKDSKIDLYFIQSKKHQKNPFSKKEFHEFSEGVKSFLIYGKVLAPAADKAALHMQQWELLWSGIKKMCSKEKTKVYVHFYYATWSRKPHKHDFQDAELETKQYIQEKSPISTGIKISDVTFTWVDGAWLAKHYTYTASKSKKKQHPRSKNYRYTPFTISPQQETRDYPAEVHAQEENFVNNEKEAEDPLDWDIGIVKEVLKYNDHTLYGYISSKKHGKVYFFEPKESSIRYWLDRSIKFKFIKNEITFENYKDSYQEEFEWKVVGNTLSILSSEKVITDRGTVAAVAVGDEQGCIDSEKHGTVYFFLDNMEEPSASLSIGTEVKFQLKEEAGLWYVWQKSLTVI